MVAGLNLMKEKNKKSNMESKKIIKSGKNCQIMKVLIVMRMLMISHYKRIWTLNKRKLNKVKKLNGIHYKPHSNSLVQLFKIRSRWIGHTSKHKSGTKNIWMMFLIIFHLLVDTNILFSTHNKFKEMFKMILD